MPARHQVPPRREHSHLIYSHPPCHALPCERERLTRDFLFCFCFSVFVGYRYPCECAAQDLDITMTVAGYASVAEDVHRNEKALRYCPSGTAPGPGEHAKL